ncbi:MAG TPA: hypothetical protein VIM69_11410 [Opitutaceae bacterium]
MNLRLPLLAALTFTLFSSARATEPLSRSYGIDFYRDVPSRNLKGLATRADGRLVAGPELFDLDGPALPSLLWCLEPAGRDHWLIGTGPNGRIVEVTFDRDRRYSVRDVVSLPEQQVFTVKALSDGSILAGTSPEGGVFLIRDNKIVSQVLLPSDSVFDIALRGNTAYVSTGSPAKIYAIDLKKFAGAGIEKTRVRDSSALVAKGITTLGEVRDRNLRRLAWVGDRLIAGSSPKGNVYAFSAVGGAPELLQENHEAEVSSILPQSDGSFFATVIFSNTAADTRINRPAAKGASDSEASSAPERFSGRTAVIYFPKEGFPETIVSRTGVALYSIQRHGDDLIFGGGEQGDFLGFDLVARESLSFAGSDSAQLNALAPLPSSSGESSAYLALRNNVSGLAILDFAATGPRSAETRRLDLGVPARVGELRIDRVRAVAPDQIKIDYRDSLGSDEVEGWSTWAPTERLADGWLAHNARAKEIRFRIQVPETSTAIELDDATLFYLPQDRRPQLGEFRIAPPNFFLLPANESSPTSITLSQLLAEHEERRRTNLSNNNVVPSPGNQLVLWTVTDPDGDAIACTFSMRREGSNQWEDISVGNRDGFVQFDTTHFSDGIYQTRLVAAEQAPRLEGERLTATFQTDDLVIDHTPPTITDLSVKREGDHLKISVSGHDALSLLEGAEFVFNNGVHETVVQPLDGIRDSQTETFVLEVPLARVAAATSVQVVLSDTPGNESVKTVAVPQ